MITNPHHLMSFYHRPRRFLLDAAAPPIHGRNDHYRRAANFDTNMVIILAALLCALICALGINSIVRCILRCATGINVRDAAADAATAPRFGRKGLRKAALRKIPVAVYGGEEQGVGSTECPICLGEFLDGDKIRVLPKCHHCFHVKCVDVWLASHSSCPTCRQSLAEEEHGGTDAAVAVAVEGNASSARHGGYDHSSAAVEEVG